MFEFKLINSFKQEEKRKAFLFNTSQFHFYFLRLVFFFNNCFPRDEQKEK